MPSAGETPTRTLALAFGGTDSFLEHEDGSLTVPNVPLLNEGAWTDSAVRTELYYPLHILQRDAGNWRDSTLWSRHFGGAPRDITDKIGEIRNPRAGARGVLGDLHLHGASAKSRDVIGMIRSGHANYVSVEHYSAEEYNPDTKRLEAVALEFVGCAVVNRGACATCTIPRDNEDGSDGTGDDSQERSMEEKLKQLADALDALKAENKALADEFAAFKKARELEQPTDEPAPAVKELTDKLAAAEARIKALEEEPAPKTGGAPDTERELGEVDTIVEIDRDAGTIRGV